MRYGIMYSPKIGFNIDKCFKSIRFKVTEVEECEYGINFFQNRILLENQEIVEVSYDGLKLCIYVEDEDPIYFFRPLTNVFVMIPDPESEDGIKTIEISLSDAVIEIISYMQELIKEEKANLIVPF